MYVLHELVVIHYKDRCLGNCLDVKDESGGIAINNFREIVFPLLTMIT